MSDVIEAMIDAMGCQSDPARMGARWKIEEVLRAIDAVGCAVVPKEATERARGIGAACIAGGLAEGRAYGQIADDVYRAMLAAAPKAGGEP